MSNATPFKCPVCNGTGKVSRDPDIAGDVESFVSNSSGPWPCPACDGKCVIWHHVEPPPVQIEDPNGAVIGIAWPKPRVYVFGNRPTNPGPLTL